MITIEEAKELGFVENNSYPSKPFWRYDISPMFIEFYPNSNLYLTAEYEDFEIGTGTIDIIISHLNAEQVKQLITLLKP